VEPLVSVNIATYNHKQFIAQCIEGVLMQRTNFSFEVIIHDDASTDGTSDLVREYGQKHDNVFAIIQDNNLFSQGRNPSIEHGLSRAKGKYVALCDGDDYWTDPYKLQKQVDFLQQNPSFSMCFHRIDVLYELKNDTFKYLQPKTSTLHFTDLLFTHMIATCSLVIRKEFLPVPYPDWLMGLVMGDIPIELLLVSKGPAHYFNETMAVYRRHSSGITQNKEQHKRGRKSYLTMYIMLRKEVGVKYFLPLSLMVCKTYLGYLKDYLKFHKTSRDKT
jgi:glycosyltransferase involved in cell wall biosynthesis